jgi:regulator of nucleoside diphosphate kinase
METEIKITEPDYIRLNRLVGTSRNEKNIELKNLDTLAGEIGRAEKVDSKKIAPEFVTMNSVVQVMNESTIKLMTIRIVYPEDVDFKRRYVSVVSPLGSALLGHKVGDTIQYVAPEGIVTIRIQQIYYQPEANGKYLV